MGKFITSDKIFHHLGALKKWRAGNKAISPVTVELHISNLCNNKCYYCCADKVKDKQLMKHDQIKKSIDFIKQQKAKAIIFSGGGEPTFNKYFNYAIKYAKQNKLDVGVITNAGLFDEKKITDIINNASWVRVSLDASDDETYYKIRGVHDYDKVKENISQLISCKENLKSKCTIGLQIVVNEYNYLCLPDTVKKIFKDFGKFDYLQVRPIETKLNENPYTKGQLDSIKRSIDEIKLFDKVIISDKWNLFFNSDRTDFGFKACHCADFIGAIDAYGNYYLCCHTVKNPAYKYCNVFDKQSIKQFYKLRAATWKRLGESKGLNPRFCPLGCRGSNINRRLEGLLYEPEHKNFL